MRVLDLNFRITRFDTVSNLAHGHPVFLLAAEEDGSKLVVKQELKPNIKDTTQALGHNLEAMALVSPTTVGSQVLYPDEVDVLHLFVERSGAMAGLFEQPESEGVVALRGYLLGGSPWFKMPVAAGIVSVAEASDQLREHADKSGVRAIAKSLNHKGGFERLGEIIAVDLYNHNHDRFTWAHATGVKGFAGLLMGCKYPWSNNRKDRFFAIRNLGNVLVAVEEGENRPVGLDSWAPNNPYATLERTVEEIDQKCGDDETKWGGHLLAPGAAALRKKFAAEVLDDLNVALGQRDRSFSMCSKKRLESNGDSRLVKGMEQGARRLIQMLQTKCANNPPRGLGSRLKILRGY
jgi:hypothetical protein